MAKDNRLPPPRKEPGILGKSFTWLMGLVFWLVLSLIISILIEWVGIKYFWPELGSTHSEKVLETDYAYLNERVTHSANRIVLSIERITVDINQWVGEGNLARRLSRWVAEPAGRADGEVSRWLNGLAEEYEEYILSIPNTVKIFFVRLAIILLSLPSFLLFAMIGMVDGLVERDLRRWGGGRESSVVYNIARKSVLRFFTAACVVYLSFPITVAPAWVIVPFAAIFGLSTRITFERFKKYF